MGYNISEVSGEFTGSDQNDVWTAEVDITDASVTVVSGDFEEAPFFGTLGGEPTSGYTFSDFNFGGFGSLSFDTVDGTFIFTINKAALFASGSDQVVSFQVSATGSGVFGGPTTNDNTVYINLLICVARGTQIMTADGLAKVEDLMRGDRVVTKDDGAQPVRWIGSRKLSSEELKANPALCPIRIEKHALGRMNPSRDLVVSPQHRVLISDWRSMLFFGQDEVLAPAKGLVNGISIKVDRSLEPVEYFHILFDAHQIIETDGTLTESFCPGDFALNALDKDVRDELFEVFPQLREDAKSYGPAARYSVRTAESGLLGAVDVPALMAA
ncbi:MAG: Hint domain-containing protein [Paracoccaceae bacterium]